MQLQWYSLYLFVITNSKIKLGKLPIVPLRFRKMHHVILKTLKRTCTHKVCKTMHQILLILLTNVNSIRLRPPKHQILFNYYRVTLL